MATLVSLEDHFVSRSMLDGSQNVQDFSFHLWPQETQDRLKSVGSLRLEDMRRGDIALQVVSGLPSSEPESICKATNDQLAEAVKHSNGRLRGFATVPIADPVAAAAELDRCVRDLGFLGVLLPNHAHGKYYDTEDYIPFWKTVEELDVPIYLHPCPPTAAGRSIYEGNHDDKVTTILSIGGWGWHADVAVHFLKLYTSGLFDICPRLKLVIGHSGEMLPYMITRVDSRLRKGWGSKERGLLTVWKENVWVTISGIWDLAPFACLTRAVAPDHLMFSVDYPFEKNESGRDFMLEVKESNMVSDEFWDMIAFGNAEKLLKVTRPHGSPEETITGEGNKDECI